MSDGKEALQEYYSECDEILQRISIAFSNLDKQPDQLSKIIDSLYRDIHTLKGTSQLFGFLRIGMIAHTVEACLEPVRSGNMKLKNEMIDQILKCVDLIGLLLTTAKDSHQEKKIFDQDINLSVTKLMDCFLEPAQGVATSFFSSLYSMTESSLGEKSTQPLMFDGQQAADQLFENIQAQQISQIPRFNQVQEKEIMKELKEVRESKEVKENIATTSVEEAMAQQSEGISTIRVQVALLDRLMNLVGELVLIRNQVQQFSKFSDDQQLIGMSQRLDVVTSDLQGEVMRTRMQPVGTVLSKFTRTVRDLSRELNKKINFVTVGAETELDKTLIEAIKDPLTHIVRNSCDHGIETPAERKEKGKSETGNIQVSAKQESGHVVIEIQDDGRGLNTKKIVSKAIEKGIISAEKASALTEQEAALLIFAPGFSTAEKVTAVSGRGVGMDVVKTNIERIGGSVEIQSELGKGAIIRLKIPLTLAIVPALIIQSQSQKFAIPQVKLVELVRVENEESEHQTQKIEFIQGQPIYRLRGQILPLISLNQIMSQTQSQLEVKSAIQFIVLSSDHGQFGLIIDEVLDTADIVVKPLEPIFKKFLIYSGATIMGDGSVSIILDVNGVAQKIKFQQSEEKKKKESQAKKPLINSLERQDYLSVSLNHEGCFIFPLTLVHRLEEIKTSDIESSLDQNVVNYRGIIMPLLNLNQHFQFDSDQVDQKEILNVVVIRRRDQFVGLVVNEILDVLNAGTEVQQGAREKRGIHGNLIENENVYTVLDVFAVIDDFFGIEESAPLELGVYSNEKTIENKKKKILLAEDTTFFVKQLMRILETEGHDVVVARDGEEAWKILETADESKPFDILISDIEMPNLNGFDLVRKVRSDEKTKNLYSIAVTTRFSQADRQRGLECGFNRYLEKLRQEEIIQAIRMAG